MYVFYLMDNVSFVPLVSTLYFLVDLSDPGVFMELVEEVVLD